MCGMTRAAHTMSDSSSNGDLVVVDVEMHDGDFNTGVLIAPNKLTWVCTREELEEEFPALKPILISYIDSSTLFTTNWVHTFDEEETTLQNHRSLEQYVQTEEDCCRFVDVHELTTCDGLYNITKQLTKLIELVPFEIYKWIGESCPESGMLWRDNFANSFQYIQPFLNAFPEANQSAQQLQMILSNHTVHSVSGTCFRCNTYKPLCVSIQGASQQVALGRNCWEKLQAAVKRVALYESCKAQITGAVSHMLNSLLDVGDSDDDEQMNV